MTSTMCNSAYVLRLRNTIIQFMLLQSVQVLIYIAIINFTILDPLKWIRSIFGICTSWLCLLCFAINMILLFGLTVMYSKNYTMKYLLVTSRFTKLKRLLTMKNQVLILLSTLFGLTNSCFHLLLTNVFNEDSDELSQTQPINKFFIIACGPFIALSFFIKYNFKEEILQYPIINQKIRIQIQIKIQQLIYHAARSSLNTAVLYHIMYCAFGYKISQYWNVFFNEEDQTFDISSLFRKDLLIYLFTFGFAFYMTLLMMHELFLMNLTQPMKFPINKENTTEDDIILKDAMCSEIPLIKMLAYQDLHLLTELDPVRRREIYTITQSGGQGQTWKSISSICIDVLQKFIDGLMRTYPKLKPTKSMDFNTFGRRGNLDVLSPSTSFRAYPMQVLKEDNEQKPNVTVKEYVTKKISSVPGINYLFGDKDLIDFKQVMSQSQIVMWANLSLTMLLKMSISEDEFGVTHNDFPKIIELMLNMRETLFSLNKIKSYKNLATEKDLQMSMIPSLEFNIKSCIYMLSDMYKPYIAKMHLSEEVKEKLNNFNNWDET